MRKHPAVLMGIGLGISGLLVISFSFGTGEFSLTGIISRPLSAQADENDGGRERERDDGYAASSSSSQSSVSAAPVQMQTITRYEVRSVTKVVDVTPEEYLRDTDGDGLVDAIDPHPTIPESEFWTDTDSDGIPNAYDKHHDEDDFSYFDDTDANHDGILDAYASGTPSIPGGMEIKDSDADGITDDAEVNVYHTDPYKFDTDGDGVGDGIEVLDGTDPLDPKSSVIAGMAEMKPGILEGDTLLWYFGLAANIVALAFVLIAVPLQILKRKPVSALPE